jgi:hypothetical protein
VHPRHADDLRVARVRAAGVGTEGALEPASVVRRVEEGVVPRRIGPELLVVAVRSERQRRAARPAADEPGREQLLLGSTLGAGTDVLAERRHPGMELAEDDVAAVAAEHLRLGRGGQVAVLVRVAQDEFAGLERVLVRVGGGDAAALDIGVADAVLEAERGPFVREYLGGLLPEHVENRRQQRGVGGAVPGMALELLVKPRAHDVLLARCGNWPPRRHAVQLAI